MSRVTPNQKLHLQHQYTLDEAELYVVMCELDGYGFEAANLDPTEVQDLLDTLLQTAIADTTQDTDQRLPIARLTGVYLLDEDGDYDPCPSAWDIQNQNCLDCDENTIQVLAEYYMVTDKIWSQVIPEQYGMICVGCLENRLGRQLSRSDFADVPLNKDDRWQRSERLQHRLTSAGELSPIR